MESQFTVAEKRKWQLNNHLKNHAFEYILDIILTVVFVCILLKLCNAENVVFGVLISVGWAVGRVAWQIHLYKKEYVNTIVK